MQYIQTQRLSFSSTFTNLLHRHSRASFRTPPLHHLHPVHGLFYISLRYRVGICLRTEVRSATEGAKDVSDVIWCWNTRLEGAVPVGDDALDDWETGDVDVRKGGEEATLASVQEVEECFFTRILQYGQLRKATRANEKTRLT